MGRIVRVEGAEVSARLATALVFLTSGAVLVLEILAGRLLAPLIGVSLETFTGIIGTVLAGIALGNEVGGRLADRTDVAPLVGPAITAGGALAWLAPILVSTLDPVRGGDPLTIVFLTAVTFFAPAAVLSAVPPMVAKLRLGDLGETGRVVGSLSAAGTLGALVGTFLTGFVLVAAFPTRPLVFGVGAVLVAVGAVLTGWTRLRTNGAAVLLIAVCGVGALALDGPCDRETAYACVVVEADPDRPSGRSLYLNGLRNSYADLDDPTYLEFRYMRLFAAATEVLPDGPLDALHIGGAGLTYPRYLAAVRPGSTGTVLEIDEDLVEVATESMGVELGPALVVVHGDARLTIADEADERYDLVVVDAFSGLTVPWHLTTTELVAEVRRVLAPGGLVVVNLVDGSALDFAAAELATYRRHFEHVTLIVPDDDPASSPVVGRNVILVAADVPLPPLVIEDGDGRVLSGPEVSEIVAGVDHLRDDHAPVDQLLPRRGG